MHPEKQLLHGGLGEALCFMKASKHQAAEHFQDGAGVQGREGQELCFGSENSIGNDCVGIGRRVIALSRLLHDSHVAGGDDGYRSCVRSSSETLDDGIVYHLHIFE